MDLEIPVLPHLVQVGETKNVVASLIGVAPLDRIAIRNVVEMIDVQSLKYSSTSIVCSLETLADLGMSSSFSLKSEVKAKSRCALASEVFQVESSEPEGGLIKRVRWAAGFRLGIVATEIDTGITLDTATKIAASATLSQCATMFQVQVVGAGADALKILKPLISRSLGSFDVEALETIGSVVEGLKKYMAAESTSLTPSPVSIVVDSEKLLDSGGVGYEPYLKASSFALERIYRYEVLSAAMRAAADHGVEPSVVRSVYADIFKLGDDERVTDKTRDEAVHILMSGR